MAKNHIIYNGYSPWMFNLKKAEGSYLWTQDDQKLIDFSSGWNVTNLGWNNSEIAEAVVAQAKTNVYAPMWTADAAQNTYAAQLTAALPKELDVVARATGGTEANEMALKMARAYTGRSKIIGFKDSYHGQSFGDLSLGYLPSYVEDIAPLVPDFIQLDYPSPDRTGTSAAESLDIFTTQLEDVLKKGDVAAILTEAGIITGWGSVSITAPGFLTVIRKMSEKYGTLLIVDEVGTGFSRCGSLFAIQTEAVTPDIITLAKGIANGAGVIGAVVTTSNIGDATYDKAKLTSTFGWTPLACAAAQKTLEIHIRDKMWEKAKADGDYALATLRQLLAGNPLVTDIRGKGMELGIALTNNAGSQVVENARKNGLHLAETGDTLQLMPPLTIERNVLAEGIDILATTIAAIRI
ncbi:MAG TPA: aspartate aminotransferase family protein [Candidatus Saccharimonadales bacterium]|nr:aspartate aminotransferase family protein [Candidatus Saccharimonadales bacterium]